MQPRPLALEVVGRHQAQLQRRRLQRRQDLSGHQVIQDTAGQALAHRLGVVHHRPTALVAQAARRAAIGHRHPPAAPAAPEDPSQEGGPLTHRPRRIGAGAVGRQPLLVGPEPLRRDVGRAAALQQHRTILRLVDRPPRPGPARHLAGAVERAVAVTIVTGIDRMM